MCFWELLLFVFAMEEEKTQSRLVVVFLFFCCYFCFVLVVRVCLLACVLFEKNEKLRAGQLQELRWWTLFPLSFFFLKKKLIIFVRRGMRGDLQEDIQRISRPVTPRG